jgi:hypothetical protein
MGRMKIHNSVCTSFSGQLFKQRNVEQSGYDNLKLNIPHRCWTEVELRVQLNSYEYGSSLLIRTRAYPTLK